MDRLNKTLAISLTTLILAGSAPQIFAARASHGASKQTGTSSSKKTDYSKPIFNSNDHCINKIKELAGKILPKIEEYNRSKRREVLNDIYNLAKENNIWLRNIFDFPSSEQEKIETINNFVREALELDIDELYEILESPSSNLSADEKDFLMKTYELLDVNMIRYLPEESFSLDDHVGLINVVKRLKEEAAEQERLAKQKKEQERQEQERQEKQHKLNEAITEICKCIKEYNKKWKCSEDGLNKVYEAVLNNIRGNKISFGDDLKIQTYQEDNSNFNSQKDEVEKFLLDMIEKDIDSIKLQNADKLTSDGLKRMPYSTKKSFIRIKNLCNVNQVLRNYIMNNYINKIREENVEKFERIVNFINQR